MSTNRHERRAAEARARAAQGASLDRNYEAYRARYQQAYRKTFERDIAESFMRGEAAAASGVDGMFIHPAGKSPPQPCDDDVLLSVSYGPQVFKARTASGHLATMVAGWPRFVEEVRKSGSDIVTDDERHDAREFIFQTVLENRQWDPTIAALAASAIAWLASTSPAGAVAGRSHKEIHYEITDNPTGADGRKSRNFRLMRL